MRSIKTDPSEAFKDTGRGNTGGVRANRLRSVLVVAEISLALVLALAAGLVLKSFGRLIKIDPGFDAHRAVTMDTSIAGPAYKDNAVQNTFWRKVLESASREPAIRSIGMVSFLPMSDHDTESGYQIEGRPAPKSVADTPFADEFRIAGDYVGTMGIALLKGRSFQVTDTATSTPVAMVDEDFVKKNFPGSDPLSHRIIRDKKRGRLSASFATSRISD